MSEARGLCVKHWRRFERYGSTDLPVRKPWPVCSIEGCDRPGYSREATVCGMHYGRYYRTGTYEPSYGWDMARVRHREERGIEFNGEKLLIKEWADRLGIGYNSLMRRLLTWPLDEALTSPKLTHGAKRPKTHS